MKRLLSTERQPWIRTAVYTFMTLTVTVIVALLLLVVLGYQFEKGGKLEQGGLLQFQSTPSGATVTLDEMKLSSQTTTKSTVDTGNHFVTFDLAGYRTWQKSITINAGQIGWLSYARLIPNTIKPQAMHDYTDLTGALASPDQKYILIHEAVDQPVFTQVDLQGDSLNYSTVTLPDGSYTAPSPGKTQTFTIDSWSNDDQAVLIRHTYDDTKSEWLLLNRSSPDKSINVSATYGITPSTVVFAGGGNRLLFVQTDNIVRRINLDEQTLSRPLASNVSTFTVYDAQTIVYTSLVDQNLQRTVGYAAVNVDTPQTIASYPVDNLPLFGTIASYFGQYYAAIVHGQTMKILAGNLPTTNNPKSMKVIAVRAVSPGTTNLATGANNRFIVATLPSGFATYDLELKKYDETTWAHPTAAPEPLHWLDGYSLWSSGGGTLRLYEFDGANQQNIMSAADGFTATLSPNGKYIYDITKTDKGYELQRGLLVI